MARLHLGCCPTQIEGEMRKKLAPKSIETNSGCQVASSGLKVMFLGPSLDGGGAERVMRAWYHGLVRAGYECLMVATDQAAEPMTPDVTRAPGRFLFGSKALTVRRRMQRFRPDIVFAAMPAWNLLAVLLSRSHRGLGPRVVISLHTIAAISSRDLPRRQRAVQSVAARLYPLADACVAVSPAVAGEAVSRFKVRPERLWLIPNPVLVSPPPASAVARVRPTESVTLVLPARLVAHKRPHVLLAVAEVLRGQGAKADVLFIGDGPLRAELEQSAKDRGITATFIGWTDPWQPAAPADSVLVLPSAVEGFGNVLVEAASVGIPSVANARALGVSAALVNGVTGVVVDDNTPKSLAVGVLAAMNLPMSDVRGWLAQFQDTSVTNHLIRMLHQVQEH